LYLKISQQYALRISNRILGKGYAGSYDNLEIILVLRDKAYRMLSGTFAKLYYRSVF